jgi:hypothetical protein
MRHMLKNKVENKERIVHISSFIADKNYVAGK